MENIENTNQDKEIQLKVRYCIFKIGNKEYSIDIKYLKEIIEIENIYSLPLSPIYIEGMVHLRGSIVPIINMARLNEESQDYTNNSKWAVVVEYKGEIFGFISNNIPDLSDIHRGDIIDIPDFFDTYRVK